MLQTLNIPSSPLPEVPSAPTAPSGDAGERAEFAQLLQQAQGAEADAAQEAPAVPSAKEARAEPRARHAADRLTPERKPHDARRADSDAEPTDDAAIDLLARIQPPVQTDVAVTDSGEAQTPSKMQAPESDDMPPAADPALPVLMQVSERLQAPAEQAPSRAMADEPDLDARVPLRTGARDVRLPLRTDQTATAPAGTVEHRAAVIDTTPTRSKDGAFDLALHKADGRSTSAPLFDRTPLDSTPAAHAATWVRELQQPLGSRTEAPAAATLQLAPDKAGFAPALGAQVTLWVKDGVQEARLHLHPAELGPVTVQIALEGQAAHIDFTAAVAATRESIEQSLPALAAALRESGFTLAGGGVFGRSGQGANHSGRERSPEGRGSRGTAGVVGADGGELPAATPRRWARSLIDVYA